MDRCRSGHIHFVLPLFYVFIHTQPTLDLNILSSSFLLLNNRLGCMEIGMDRKTKTFALRGEQEMKRF